MKADGKSTAAEIREADYFKAKSLLSMNEREAAFEIFASLSSAPSTAEGAEAAYMIIQDACDQGKYDTVEKKVYAFAEKAGDQSYWLAKDNLAQAKATFESVQNGYKPAEGTSDDVLDNVRMRLEKLKTMM